MKSYQLENYRYTAGFCEENIWWLAHSLKDDSLDIEKMKVLFFSNSEKSILLVNQRVSEAGRPMLWDYHVVLQADIDDDQWIFDFDTRLAFPEKFESYRSKTFPHPSILPEQYRTQVRTIPAKLYLKHFYSDRTHMQGKISKDDFPDYPVIQPDDGEGRILLSEFWDMQKDIEGCKVETLNRI